MTGMAVGAVMLWRLSSRTGSWYMLSNNPGDTLKPYVFPLAIVIVKWEKFALAPRYLRSLYAWLDECVANVVRSAGRFGAVTHIDTFFSFCGSDSLVWLRSQRIIGRHGRGAVPRWLKVDETMEHP